MSSETAGLDIISARRIERLLIVRLSAMGDVIHTLPALYALRAAFPQAHIGWLIEERWAELLCAPGASRRGARSGLRPLVDEVHAVDLKAWRKSLFSISTWQRAATVWNDVRDAGYEVAVDLQGAMRSAVLARLSGAGVVYGAAEPRESPASLWYTRKVVAHGRHVIEQNLSVAEAIAQEKVAVPRVEFPIDPFPVDLQVEDRIARDLAQHGAGEFALLNPGAGWGAKRWPAERYGEVGELRARRGRSFSRSVGGERRQGPADERFNHGIDCIDAAGADFHWRRHGAAASGGGVAGPGGGDFRADRSGAQWTLRNAAYRIAERGERYVACAAGGGGGRDVGDWE